MVLRANFKNRNELLAVSGGIQLLYIHEPEEVDKILCDRAIVRKFYRSDLHDEWGPCADAIADGLMKDDLKGAQDREFIKEIHHVEAL